MKYFLLTIILPPCWSQLMNIEMRPDVTFDDHNDRFDITDLVAKQNIFFSDDNPTPEYRRRGPTVNVNKLAAVLRQNLRDNKDYGEFAYHDRMNSEEGGDEKEFYKSLKDFENSRRFWKFFDNLQKRSSRRSGGVSVTGDVERDALLQYAVPVDLKIDGYIKAPLAD